MTMKMFKGWIALGAVLGCLTTGSHAFAWGAKGHEIVGYTGADLTTGDGHAFFAAQETGIRQLSTVPDRVWKEPATKDGESPNHWFQADAYMSSITAASEIYAFPKAYNDATAKYGESEIVTNGTSPWRVVQFYNRAVQDLKTGDMKSAVEDIGVMSHYIGDLSQPLHDSVNYDGAKTGDTGIHKFFETTNIVDEDSIRDVVSQKAQALLNDPDFTSQFQGDLMDVIFHEVARSVAERDLVINTDLQQGRKTAAAKAALLAIAEERMADGAATFSLVLNRLWADAGVHLQATPITIEDPAWIAPDFGSTSQVSTPINPDMSMMVDDCLER